MTQRSELLATRTEVTSEVGVVSAGHMAEAEAGARILAAGGNAIDGLVAAAFAAFVVEPQMCGLAGYGRLAAHVPGDGFFTIDHSARVPAGARADMFEVDEAAPPTYYGWPQTKGRGNQWGHLSVAVPGAVAGLCLAHERWGRLRLAEVLDPAIELAEAGLLTTWELILAIAERRSELEQLPHAAAFLLADGAIPSAYAPRRLDLSELARVLREIAARGAAGFYDGWVAEAIEREARAGGGILTAADLAAYRPRVLRERPGRFADCDYITAYDQVGYEALNLLERFDVREHDPHSAELRHLMAEALGHSYVDSMLHYGDPDFAHSPVDGLASPDFARERARGISLERAAPRPIEPGDPWPFESVAQAPGKQPGGPSAGGVRGTSQVAAVDRDGLMCSLCTTVGSTFGSVVLVPGTGIFLTNAMQNYDPRPDRANRIEPGRMPIFGVPEIVATRNGEAVFGAAGSGGYRITTGVLTTMVGVLAHGLGLQESIDVPRVHNQGDETFVDSRIPAGVRKRLSELGHRVVVQEEAPGVTAFGRVSAVTRDPATGVLRAGSGPAWSTAAAGA
jgi:gamma-glutamyltranspeptidase/glutathione hydrolase